MKKSIIAAAGLVAALAAAGAWPQDAAKQLVGTWRLMSDTNTKDGVTRKGAAFGENPKGMMIFTSDGHYSSVSTRGDLPAFAAGNRMQGTADENKAIVQGSIAHFGTYKVSADGRKMLLTPESGTWPAWNGKEQARAFEIKGDELKYTVAASSGGTGELVYKRVKK
jgi:hypothetical protein